MQSSMRLGEIGKDFPRIALRLKIAKPQHAMRPTTLGACFQRSSSGRPAPRKVSVYFICEHGWNERKLLPKRYVFGMDWLHNQKALRPMMGGI